MAILSDADRAALTGEYARTGVNQPVAVTKTDLRAALNAADAWVDANAGAYNAALPAAFRTTATAKQKAALLMFIIRRRYEVS